MSSGEGNPGPRGKDDHDLRETISHLVEQEHRLRQGEIDDDDRHKLAAIEERLDQAWDLLRQRQALREARLDPSEAHERPTGEVEGYLQ